MPENGFFLTLSMDLLNKIAGEQVNAIKTQEIGYIVCFLITLNIKIAVLIILDLSNQWVIVFPFPFSAHVFANKYR